MLTAVLNALQELRSPFALYENDIHLTVEKCFAEAALPYVHEARLSPGCRIDYLVGEVGVEIKKGKPNAKAVAAQLLRYAASDRITALVVVSQRSVSLPKTALGKPVYLVVLDHLWGVALP